MDPPYEHGEPALLARFFVGLAIVAIIGAGAAFILARHHSAPIAQPTPCDVMRDAGPKPDLDKRDACRTFVAATVANLKNDTSAGAERATLQAADDYRSLFKVDVASGNPAFANEDYADGIKLYAIADLSLENSVSQRAALGLRDLQDSFKRQ